MPCENDGGPARKSQGNEASPSPGCSGYFAEEFGPVGISRSEMGMSYTLFGICLLVAVAVLSTKEQRNGVWLLAAVGRSGDHPCDHCCSQPLDRAAVVGPSVII